MGAGIKNVCDSTSTILGDIRRNKWLFDRTLVIRYEDLAMKPVYFAKKVLEHAGLDFSYEVRTWIEKNTKGIAKSAENEKLWKPFLSDRDSRQTALKWRESILLENAKEIQKLCANEMGQLNYLPVYEKLTNMTEVIIPFEKIYEN